MKAFLSAIVMVVIAYYAGLYGYYWDSQANPRVNSTVYADEGHKYTGSVSRTWRGDYQIETDDGSVVVVYQHAFVGAAYPNADNDASGGWRMLLPPLLVVFLFLIKDIRGLLRGWTPTAGENKSVNTSS